MRILGVVGRRLTAIITHRQNNMSLTPDEIRSEARKLLAFFSTAELLVLKTHIAIHRNLTRRVARARGVDPSSLRRLSFLAAAKEVHGKSINARLFKSLELLNEARNIVAHEESTGEIFIKVAEIGHLCEGPGYNERPSSADDANAQFKRVLTFVEGWATNP